MNNMPAFAIGMADRYEGPDRGPSMARASSAARVPGNAALSQRLIESVMHDVDVAFAEEWKFDHGIMVPLHFLTPRYDLPVIPVNINCQGPPLTPLHARLGLRRGAAPRLRRACRERIALIGTGGISHWPATPDSGKINEAWDRRVPGALGAQRPRRPARLHRRGHLSRRRPGRLRDPHVHRGRAAATEARRASCCSTRRSRSSRSAAPSRTMAVRSGRPPRPRRLRGPTC